MTGGLPPALADLAHDIALLSIQMKTVLALSALNLIANVLTIGVAFIAAVKSAGPVCGP